MQHVTVPSSSSFIWGADIVATMRRSQEFLSNTRSRERWQRPLASSEVKLREIVFTLWVASCDVISGRERLIATRRSTPAADLGCQESGLSGFSAGAPTAATERRLSEF